MLKSIKDNMHFLENNLKRNRQLNNFQNQTQVNSGNNTKSL